jgi:hypothetical protein
VKDEETQKVEDQAGDEQTVSTAFALPLGWKVGLACIFGAPGLFVLFFIAKYSFKGDAKPSELGLGTVLIFCLAGLALVLIPWDLLGLRLKKFGPLEFERVINTQKQEQSESLAHLQKQIDELRQAAGTKLATASVATPIVPSKVDLPAFLKKFFANYPRRFFSPFTIKSWGGRQPEFKELASFEKEDITQALLSMLAKNEVQTKISKKGNTLYGIRP